jgi:hypothetical protein
MPFDLGYFQQEVSVTGYRIIQWHGEPWITSGIPHGADRVVRKFNPFRNELGLFRTFAALDQSDDSILRFANSFGLLGIVPTNYTEWPILELRPDGSGLIGSGERLGEWRLHLAEMSELTEIWLTANGNPKGLRKWFDERKPGKVRLKRHGFTWVEEPVRGAFQKDDLVVPARQFIRKAVSERLDKLRVTAALLWTSQVSEIRLRVVPTGLIGCMWLQFAQAIAGNRNYRPCEFCGKYFESTSGISRSDRRFCQPTCKASAHKKSSRLAEYESHATRGRVGGMKTAKRGSTYFAEIARSKRKNTSGKQSRGKGEADV